MDEEVAEGEDTEEDECGNPKSPSSEYLPIAEAGQYNILISFLIILNHYVSIAQGRTVDDDGALAKQKKKANNQPE